MKKTIFVGVVSALFIFRFFFFLTTQDPGVEHDSGWYLGVARNVAERGIYASYTNTVVSEGVGPQQSIHGRFSVQDKRGLSYFPAGVTVGPGYILPQAFIFKVFGVGFWQLKVLPVVTFILLVPLLFFIVINLGSFTGVLFFLFWLWFYPQLFLNQFHEAFGEHLAFLYFCISLLFLTKKGAKNPRLFFVSGLFFSLSFLTKSVFLVTGGGIVLFIVHTLISSGNKKRVFTLFVFFLSGAIILPFLFELYKAGYLFAHFGKEGYFAVLKDQNLTMQCCGSGISLASLKQNAVPGFVLNKLNVWNHVGISFPILLIWPFIFLTSVDIRKKHPFVKLLYFSGLSHLGWFVVFSPTGWFRHVWPGIILLMMYVCVVLGEQTNFLKKPRSSFLFFVLFSIALFGLVITDKKTIPSFTLHRASFSLIQRTTSPNHLQGPLFAPTFYFSDQKDAAMYISKHIPADQRICYLGTLLVAELPVLADRVMFPIERCSKGGILIFGPYQRGEESVVGEEASLSAQTVWCEKVVYKNPSYLLCLMKRY